MTKNKLTIWTLILSCFIVLGSGHGIGLTILLEPLAVIEFFSGNLNFDIKDSGQNGRYSAALVLLVGQVILPLYKIGNEYSSNIISIIGCSCMLIAVYFISSELLISMLSAIPFVIACFLLLIKSILSLKMN